MRHWQRPQRTVQGQAGDNSAIIGFYEKLLSVASASATSARVTRVPAHLRQNGYAWAVFDAGTTEAEVRKVTLSGDTLSWIGGLAYSHSSGDAVLLLDIPNLKLEWFGGKGDGSTDNSTAMTRALAQAETANAGGWIDLGAGEYQFDSAVLCNSADYTIRYRLRGVGYETVIKPQGFDSLSDGIYLFHVNYDSGGTYVADDYRTHVHFILQDCTIDGDDSTTLGVIKGYNRQIHMRNVLVKNCWRGIYVDGYSDVPRIENVKAITPQVADDAYLLESNSHGDGLYIAQANVISHGLAKLNKCSGGLIAASILNDGWCSFSNVHGLTIQNCHVENDELPSGVPGFTLTSSTVTMRDNFMFGGNQGTSTPILIYIDDNTGGYREKSDLLLDNNEFSLHITANDSERGRDIKLQNFNIYSRLRLRGNKGSVYATNQAGNVRWTFDNLGFTLSADSTSINNALIANKALWLSDCELKFTNGAWELTPLYPYDGAVISRSINAPTFTLNTSTSYPASSLSADTYYYLVGQPTPYGSALPASEDSIAISDNETVLILVNIKRIPGVVRIWRGTTTGTYDNYVDIPVLGTTTELYDTGGFVSGYAWETTSIPTPNAANSTFDGYIHGTKRIAYGSAAPTAGTWSAGDIVYDTTPSAGSTIGWVCVSGGSPGTWKAFGSIAA